MKHGLIDGSCYTMMPNDLILDKLILGVEHFSIWWGRFPSSIILRCDFTPICFLRWPSIRVAEDWFLSGRVFIPVVKLSGSVRLIPSSVLDSIENIASGLPGIRTKWRRNSMWLLSIRWGGGAGGRVMYKLGRSSLMICRTQRHNLVRTFWVSCVRCGLFWQLLLIQTFWHIFGLLLKPPFSGFITIWTRSWDGFSKNLTLQH